MKVQRQTIGWLITLTCLSTLSGCDNQTKAASGTSAVASAVVSPPPTAKQVKTYEGPFGLDMGISVDVLAKELGFAEPATGSSLFEGIPPKPAPFFNTYYVGASKASGLCKIIAVTEKIDFNDSGDQVKQKVDSIAEALEVKYGKGEHFDFVKGTYKDSKYWAMAAKEDQATYVYIWDKKHLNASNNLDSIIVEPVIYDYKSGAVRVVYDFKNVKDCDKEKTKKQSDNL